MSPTDCPLCRKLADLDSLRPRKSSGDFPHGVAVLGPWQYYHGYCLLVARRHATELSGLDETNGGTISSRCVCLARAIEDCFPAA